MLKKIITKRRIIQALVGAGLYFSISYLGVPLLYVVAGGAALGLIFGKVFCRWMCPIGFVIELLLGRKGGKGGNAQQMYMYHKVGCPIAWISGMLNKSSLFSIQRDYDSCIDCGLCDKACYIASLNEEFSHFEWGKKLPYESYSCSRCLDCVTACPKGSLTYSLDL